ncbi:MAG TPA: hypothetical protein VN851_24935 [Thermoanaerobaculia bacterium]|nr:hypothetical protein [Thermoanaerobaculia bacterium]
MELEYGSADDYESLKAAATAEAIRGEMITIKGEDLSDLEIFRGDH